MAQEVFARIEKKFLLRPEQYKALRAVFDEKMAQDAYGRHTILNIYLDTSDYELTRESIEKPIYKEKVRLRAYGMPKEDDKVFLEIKKKYKGVVYKRRAEMTLRQAREYLSGGEKPPQDSQIACAMNGLRFTERKIPTCASRSIPASASARTSWIWARERGGKTCCHPEAC